MPGLVGTQEVAAGSPACQGGPVPDSRGFESTMKMIETPDAPRPGGHYSQAVSHGGLVYVSGILPIGPDGVVDAGRPFAAQVACVLANGRAILAAADSGLDKVLKTTVYLADVGLWPEFNRLYGEAMGAHRPARSVVPVPALHHGFLIEIEFVAVAG